MSAVYTTVEALIDKENLQENWQLTHTCTYTHKQCHKHIGIFIVFCKLEADVHLLYTYLYFLWLERDEGYQRIVFKPKEAKNVLILNGLGFQDILRTVNNGRTMLIY